MNTLLEHLTMEDLSGENYELAETIGLEAFKKLVSIYGGSAKLYIPTVQKLTVSHRNAHIRKEYREGKNVFELARKWGLTDRWIHEIVKGEVRNEPSTCNQ